MPRHALTRLAALPLRPLPARAAIRTFYNSHDSGNGNNGFRGIPPQGQFSPQQRQQQQPQGQQYGQQGQSPAYNQGVGEDAVLPGVNQEAEAMHGYFGGGKPQTDEYGTPVEEVINRSPEARDKAPEVLKGDSTNNFSHHLARTRVPNHTPTPEEPHLISHILTEELGYPETFVPTFTTNPPNPDMPVSKYPLPPVPIPGTNRLRSRYPEIVDLVTNLIMQHGKKATAQKNMSTILRILQTKNAPRANDKYLLATGTPPLETLPLNPIAYLQAAVDSVAPLIRIRNLKGSGGFANQLPVPLNLQQRRRTAIMWMLSNVEKKAGGMQRFAERFADEVVAVVEGRSAAWERRTAVHKLAVASRANVRG